MALTAQRNIWVTIQYRLFDSTNEPIEEDDREMTYLHGGYGEVFERIEQIIDSAEVGAQHSVYLEPEDSFGDYDASLIRLAKLADLPDEVEQGMVFEGYPGEPNDGLMYCVTDIAGDSVVLDANHPLAGMSVRFELTVVDLVPATEEEIQAEIERAGIAPANSPRMLH
jgi:FKBP-type peptidyl-prolyl cis-trans isomerase SlyD